MNKQIRIIILSIISVLLILGVSSNSFAGTYLGLASAVKSRVQQLKDEKEKQQEESIAITATDGTDVTNHPPVIASLTANPASIPVAINTTITCSASDPDNNPLAYGWSAAQGIITGTGSIIIRTAPATSGSYMISCTVSDGKGGTAQQSVTVTATAVAPPAPIVPANWTKQFGTIFDDEGLAVATDTSGNIYITGWTDGDLDGNTNKGSHDIFLIKYDITGTKIWTKLLGTSVADEGLGVAVDPSGNVYVTGYTFGDLDGNTNQGGQDVFLTKYNTSGVRLWTRQFGTSADEAGMGVATDSSGNIYVTGWTTGDLNGNTNQGGYDIFITKYDTNGTSLWTKLLGTSAIDEGLGVAVDHSDNIYVTGYTFGNLDGNTNKGGKDVFLAKFNTSGSKLWTKQFGSSVDDESHGVATDASGNIYITGLTSGNLDGNTSQGGEDIFLTKFDASGAKLWTKQYGTSADDAGLGVAVNASGNIYVTGLTAGGLDGNVNQGGYDIFLTKFDSSGSRLWTKQYGTSADDAGLGVALDSSGNIDATGWTKGGLNANANQGSIDMFLIRLAP